MPSLKARPRFMRWLVWGNALVLTMVAALAIVALHRAREVHESRGELAARNAARTMAQAVASEIEQIDLLLRAVILGIERERRDGVDDPAVVQKILETRRALLPHILTLRSTDANGIVRHGSGIDSSHPIDVSDRDYFIQARGDAQSRLFISGPLMGHTSQRWVLVFARRLNTAQGVFAGVVYISVGADRFQQILASADLGPQGAASLRTANLRLVARSAATSADGETLGSDLVSPELREALKANPKGGSYQSVTALDKIERRAAFAPVNDSPLLVIAGLATSEFMAPWHNEVRSVTGLAGAAAAILLLSSWLLLRAWRQQSRIAFLREQEARRNEALLHTASDGIHVLNREGRLVEFSDSFAAMLGYNRSEMTGMSTSRWEATISAEQVLEWCRSTQGDSRFKTRHRRRDGSLIDVEVTSRAVQAGGEDLIYCSSRDMTQQRQLAREAREHLELARQSEQRLREIADNVPASILYVDAQQTLQFANSAFSHLLGRPLDDLVGQPLAKVFGTGYAARADAIAAALRGETIKFAQSVVDANGHTIHLESNLVPRRGDTGQVEGFYSLTQDLTARIELERRLERQTRNLSAMTAITDDITVVLDAQGRILVANRAFEDYWEFPTGGASGRTVTELYGLPFFRDVIQPKVQRALSGETVRLRAVHELRGRGPRSFDVTYHPVRNEHGVIDAVVFTSHDVDDLSRVIEQLKRSNESLEQFVRITSHDLREPLNTIAQFVSLIERTTQLQPPLDQYFGYVHRGATRMKAMLDDLLRFVRLESEEDGRTEKVELDEVLREVVAALGSQIETSKGCVEVAPLPRVLGGHGLLVLLFQNLVSNALKFTPPGVAPRAEVTAETVADKVRVTVRDHGIGIASGDLPRLFEPFRRLHRRQVYEGTGLGLATCKRIVEALHGAIDIQSTPGEGTRVVVTLTAAPAKEHTNA